MEENFAKKYKIM